MITGRPNKLVCSLRRDGFATAVPDPESLIELRPFVDAYRAVHEPGRYEVPSRKQPPQEIGRFALATGMAPIRRNELVAAAAPFVGRSHHCARMRQADLVVDYVEGDAPLDAAVQFGAVFRASEEANQLFAESEPPTHDEWVLDGLKGSSRGVVQLAKKFVADRMRNEMADAPDVEAIGDAPLGYLSSRLAGLVVGSDGDKAGASQPGGQGSGGGRRSTATPRFVRAPSLVDEGGEPVLVAVIEMPDWASSRTVRVDPVIVLDAGTEAPDESDQAATLGWRSMASGDQVAGNTLTLDRNAERTWEVRVRPAIDAVVRLVISVEEEV